MPSHRGSLLGTLAVVASTFAYVRAVEALEPGPSHAAAPVGRTGWAESADGEVGRPANAAFAAGKASHGSIQVTEIIDSSGAGTPGSFINPDGLAVEADGTVYIAACGLGVPSEGVFRVSAGGAITKIAGGLGDGVHRMTCPVGIVRSESGTLYVAAYLSDNVMRIESDGSIVQLIGPEGDGVNALVEPLDVAIGQDGSVYVTGGGSDNVFRVDAIGGITQIIDHTGDGTSPLMTPFGVDVDRSNNVYIAGFNSDNVFRVTPDGAVSEVLDPMGDRRGNALEAPLDVVIDSVGTIYVSGNFSDNVFRIDPGGDVTAVMTELGDGTGHILDNPTGIAVDWLGNLFVTAFESENVFWVSPEGEIRQILDASGDGTHAYWGPSDFAMAATPDGTKVFATGTLSHNVFRIDVHEPARLVDHNPRASTPGDGTHDTLWRTGRNVVRLFFDRVIALPAPGEVEIREMLPDGLFGEDRSESFTFELETDDVDLPRILKITDANSVWTNRTWFALRNTGGWTDVDPFEAQYPIQMGDANNDGRVLPNDLSFINSFIPIIGADDRERSNINTDANVLPSDLSAANSFIPSLNVLKPSGH